MTDHDNYPIPEDAPAWYAEAKEAGILLSGDRLGPFFLVSTGDFTLNEDDLAGQFTGKVRVRVYDSQTQTNLLDEEVDPIFPEDGYTTLDQASWKMRAEAAIVEAGYDFAEVLAAAAQGNAA